MAQEATESEPTMEEILASIRRIIDEDEQPADEAAAEEAPAAEAAPEPEPEPEPAASEEDVLELTDKVDEPSGGTEPLSVEDDLMIVDRDEDEELVEAPEPDPVAVEPMLEPEPEPEPEPVAAAPEPAPAPAPEPVVDEDALLDQTAASAAAGAFSALNENLRIGSGEGTTLETIVRELMRPMLKQWLDTNLPRIVEEKVEAEIARVSRRR